MILSSTVIGGIAGLGFGAASFIASEFWRDGFRRMAVLSGVGIQVVSSLVAFALGPFFIVGPLCQRPPVG